MDCGRCDKQECKECQKVNEEIRQIQLKACPPNCHCLCVLQRFENDLKDVDIFSESFKLGCGDPIISKLIERIRNMEKAMILERIQYKTEKDNMQRKITTLTIQIQEIVRQLSYRGITIKI